MRHGNILIELAKASPRGPFEDEPPEREERRRLTDFRDSPYGRQEPLRPRDFGGGVGGQDPPERKERRTLSTIGKDWAVGLGLPSLSGKAVTDWERQSLERRRTDRADGETLERRRLDRFAESGGQQEPLRRPDSDGMEQYRTFGEQEPLRRDRRGLSPSFGLPEREDRKERRRLDRFRGGFGGQEPLRPPTSDPVTDG